MDVSCNERYSCLISCCLLRLQQYLHTYLKQYTIAASTTIAATAAMTNTATPMAIIVTGGCELAKKK
jgi:hypothetical protein